MADSRANGSARTAGVHAEAAAPPKPSSERRWAFYLGIGVLSANIGKVTRASSGETSTFDTWYPQLSFQASLPLWTRWSLNPVFIVTPFGRDTYDSAASRRYFVIGAPVAYSIRNLELKGGAGSLIHYLHGNGGSTELKNGTTTSTFYLPSTSSTSSYLYLSLGIGFKIARFRLDWDTFLTGLISGRRALSTTAGVSYEIL